MLVLLTPGETRISFSHGEVQNLHRPNVIDRASYFDNSRSYPATNLYCCKKMIKITTTYLVGWYLYLIFFSLSVVLSVLSDCQSVHLSVYWHQTIYPSACDWVFVRFIFVFCFCFCFCFFFGSSDHCRVLLRIFCPSPFRLKRVFGPTAPVKISYWYRILSLWVVLNNFL